MSSKSDKLNNVTFIVKNARLSFPHLTEPKSTKGGSPRYQASLLLDPKDPAQKEQILAIKKCAEDMATSHWGKKVPSDRSCIRKGDDEDGNPRYDGYGGMWAISAARAEKQGQPRLVDRKKNAFKDDATAAKTLFAGCRVNAKINIYANEYEGVKRINATLEVVQFVRDDEPFGAAPATVDDMPDVEEDDLDDDLDTPPAKGQGKGKAAAADDDDDL